MKADICAVWTEVDIYDSPMEQYFWPMQVSFQLTGNENNVKSSIGPPLLMLSPVTHPRTRPFTIHADLLFRLAPISFNFFQILHSSPFIAPNEQAILSVLIPDRNIEHIPGIIVHICLRGKNIAGGYICLGYGVRSIHGVTERLTEHYRRRPMWKRTWVGHERVPGRLSRVRWITNVWPVRVIVAVVTITVCPAVGR